MQTASPDDQKKIVSVMKKHGFSWGGKWKAKKFKKRDLKRDLKSIWNKLSAGEISEAIDIFSEGEGDVVHFQMKKIKNISKE